MWGRNIIGDDALANFVVAPHEDIDNRVRLDLISLEEVLNSIGADAVRHGSRSLSDHLRGTYRVLRKWGVRDAVAVAGMFHSIYSTESFGHQTVPLDRRPLVQELIGQEAERLAFLFAASPRNSLRQAIRAIPESGRTVNFNLKHRFQGVEKLTMKEFWDLLTIDAANTAEQSETVTGLPSIWLSSLSDLELSAKRHGVSLCPPLGNLLRPIELHDERHARDLYLEFFEEDNTFEARPAMERFEVIIRLIPNLIEGQLWLSWASFLNEDWDRGMLAAKEASKLLTTWGTTWDKRLSWDEASDLVRSLLGSGDRREAITRMKSLRQNWRRSMVPLPAMRRVQQYLQSVRDEKQIGWYPGLTAQPLHDAKQFAVVRALEGRYRELREEVLGLNEEGFHEESENIRRVGNWKVYMLWELGWKRNQNCSRLPTLVSILESDARVRRTNGLIYVSRLSPHTEVTAHRGPTNLRLRLHMPFLVPEGDCGMRVGDQTYSWSEGKAVVFDDYYEHEVWNRTNQQRIVLVADLWHPDLSHEEVNLLNTMDSMIDMQSQSRILYWQRNERSRKAERHG